LEDFGPDMRHISGNKNIVADAMNRLTTANQDPSKQSTETQDLNEEEAFPLKDKETFQLQLPLIRMRQQTELNQINKLKQLKLLNKQESGYNISTIEEIEIVTYKDKICIRRSLRQQTINWCHHV